MQNTNNNARFLGLGTIAAIGGAIVGGINAFNQNKEAENAAEKNREYINNSIATMNKINAEKIKLMQADFDVSESYNTNYQLASGFEGSNFNRINKQNREKFNQSLNVEKEINKLNIQQLEAGKPVSPSGFSQFTNILSGGANFASSFVGVANSFAKPFKK